MSGKQSGRGSKSMSAEHLSDQDLEKIVGGTVDEMGDEMDGPDQVQEITGSVTVEDEGHFKGCNKIWRIHGDAKF